MQDLKTGHLLGASPRAQFYGQVRYRLFVYPSPDQLTVLGWMQMIGSAASVFISSGVYILYRSVYEFPSTTFPVPTAAIW